MPPPRNAYGKASDRDFHIFEDKLRVAIVIGDRFVLTTVLSKLAGVEIRCRPVTQHNKEVVSE